jgi:hypothetical protein
VRNLKLHGGNAQLGAGLRVEGGSPTLQNLAITNNACDTGQCVGVGLLVNQVQNAVIEDITVSGTTGVVNSQGQQASGIGVFLGEVTGAVSRLTITNTTGFGSNNGTVQGLALKVYFGNLVMRDVLIGGASMTNTQFSDVVRIEQASIDIARVIFASNTYGGAFNNLFRANGCFPLRMHNVIAHNNHGASSGVIEVSNTNADLAYFTIAVNGLGDAGPGAALGVNGVAQTASTLRSSIFVNNSGTIGVNQNSVADLAASYSAFFQNGALTGFDTDPIGVDGNVAADPLLNGALIPQAGSPAIDGGDPAELDRDGTRADMGAYGGPDGLIPQNN